MRIDLVTLLDKQLTQGELCELLRYELGSSNPDYFLAVKKGGLRLQQVPEEYSGLLMMMQEEIKPTSYCELGIGNGGSWLVMTHFVKSITKSVAVDNLIYGNLINQKIEDIEEIERFFVLQGMKRKIEATFYQKTTEQFFNYWGQDDKFDVVFIDADHSYAGVKFDYEKSLDIVKKGGYLIFHDIVSKGAPGVKQLWNEIKDNYQWKHEFVNSNTCGIGIVRVD